MSIAGTGGDEVSRTPDPSDQSPPATVRPGPAALPADSWDSPPPGGPDGWNSLGPWIPAGPQNAAGESDSQPYQGHRRADPPRRPRSLVVGLVLLALAAIVIVPLVWSGSGQDHRAAVAPTATSGTGAGTSVRSGGDASLAPATGALGATSAPDTTTAGVVAPRPSNPGGPRTTAPIMPPVTFEAEGPNVTIAGSAFVTAYPGASKGSIVRNLGRWDDNPGTLRFNAVVIPAAGTYVLTFYAVDLDGEPTRSAQITVSGANPVTVTFKGSATCCTPTRVTMVLAGTHTVMVANATGHAPSLDKLVVGRA